jgi:hypothetical protein
MQSMKDRGCLGREKIEIYIIWVLSPFLAVPLPVRSYGMMVYVLQDVVVGSQSDSV